jgi:predicted transcriptional regulator
MEFMEWLVAEGYITEESQIEYELSATEVDILYQKWKETE